MHSPQYEAAKDTWLLISLAIPIICRARLEVIGGWPKGLENPMPKNFKGIAAMFYAYHAVSPHPSMRNLLNVGPLQQLPVNSIQQFQPAAS